jgi:hypothetical protein
MNDIDYWITAGLGGQDMEAIIATVNAFAVVILVLVTIWYAYSTHRILAATITQAEAAARQADATMAHLALFEKSALPEWDLLYSTTPSEARITIKNNGTAPARGIQISFSPDPAKVGASTKVDQPLGTWVSQAGTELNLHFCAGTGEYEGVLSLRSMGRWGLSQESTWEIHVGAAASGGNTVSFEILDSGI